MLDFEKFLLKNNFKLISGNLDKQFSTYDNCQRLYKKENKIICIGLYAKPTRIGIIYPILKIKGKKFDNIPIPEEYESILQELWKIKHYDW